MTIKLKMPPSHNAIPWYQDETLGSHDKVKGSRVLGIKTNILLCFFLN